MGVFCWRGKQKRPVYFVAISSAKFCPKLKLATISVRLFCNDKLFEYDWNMFQALWYGGDKSQRKRLLFCLSIFHASKIDPAESPVWSVQKHEASQYLHYDSR